MGYRKRTIGTLIDRAQVRLDGVTQIDTDQGTNQDYGTTAEPLTQTQLEAQIDAVTDLVSKYNHFLEQADAIGNEIVEEAKVLRTMNSRVLSGVRSKFGPDSTEYEQVGGTRTSEKKKPAKKKPA